jgi:hypothetical protein
MIYDARNPFVVFRNDESRNNVPLILNVKKTILFPTKATQKTNTQQNFGQVHWQGKYFHQNN